MSSKPSNLKALKSNHIFVDPDSPPLSGYILINGSQIESIHSFDSPTLPDLKSLKYQIFDYENQYIFPGIIDLNVHTNSSYDEEWEDIENIGKMALQGGITTIIDNPIMNKYGPDFDEKNTISLRIHSLENRLYTDIGLLAYLGPHNLSNLEEIWSSNNIIGFRLYLSRSLMHDLPHFETKHYPDLKKKIESLSKNNYIFYAHCESATGRDLFTCSPLRYQEKAFRLDLKKDIKDASKFGGGIQGEMNDLDGDSNKSSSSDSETEEKQDNVLDLQKKSNQDVKQIKEISSGVLKKKADKNAKLQEEQSIARLEIIGYSFNEEEKETLKNYNSSDSELEFINHSSDSSGEESHKISTEENIPHKEIKVENLKNKLVTNKVIMSKSGQKRQSFLHNPLIGSLRDALDHLTKDENEENVITQPNTCDTPVPRNKGRSPSSLLQRRKMTGSPTQAQNTQSPTQSMINADNNNPGLTEFKIKVKKAAEEQESYDKELKINRDYLLLLSNHSLSWETNGVNSLLTFLTDQFTSNPKGNLILSNLSSSNSAFLVRSKSKALQYNLKIYCETSTPFIYFQTKYIKPGQSKFKCSPCIRDKETRNLLIDGLLLKNLIHAVSSFHLQTDKKYKKIEKGNFKRCFNGVSTIGSNLQVVWTKLYCREKKKHDHKDAVNEKKYETIFKRLVYLLASSPAEIAGLEKKGKIKAGFDADLVIWNPFKMIEMNEKNIYLKYRNLYLFKGQKFYGEVKETFLGGKCVFSNNNGFFGKNGKILSHR